MNLCLKNVYRFSKISAADKQVWLPWRWLVKTPPGLSFFNWFNVTAAEHPQVQ